MDVTADEIKLVNEEVRESVQTLQDAWNDVKKTRGLLEPELHDMIQKIRSSRMAVTTELAQSLTLMKDVRKFFLDSDYKLEMERLERFVSLAERLKHLIQDGTMDAVCDLAIKLSIGREV